MAVWRINSDESGPSCKCMAEAPSDTQERPDSSEIPYLYYYTAPANIGANLGCYT